LGRLVRSAVLRALLPLVAAVRLAAQLPEAEAAFRSGDYTTARAAYERVLTSDSLNVRALYRLAILDSWDGKLARSLQRFVRLRRLEPRDGDIMVAQAQVLAWAGKTSAAEALYDSVLRSSPGRVDALGGRARAVAWSGDLDRAERLWREALALQPDNAELLVGLAQTLAWKGQPALAETYAARARAVAPGDKTARDLELALRAALRPEVASSVDGAGDSDDNHFVAQEATVTTSFGPNLRGTVHAGWRRATDPTRNGTSYGGGGYAIVAIGRGAVLRLGAGVRRVEPDNGPARTPFTAQLGVGLRPGRYTAVSVGYGRTPFDETAGLMRQDLRVDGVDLSFDVSPRPGWSISGGANATWLSDGNRRLAAVVAVLGRVLPGLQLGPFARTMGYRENPGTGYFAPDRFTVIEGRAVYAWQKRRWGLRADGGLGSQQVFKSAAHQMEWHIGLTLSRGWGANNEIALAGAITNSAGATTSTGVRTESFRYSSLRLSFRQGL
jgi:tetratricopeptide (TPR) repeat protein